MFNFFKKQNNESLIPTPNLKTEMPKVEQPREKTLFEKYNFPIVGGYQPLNGPDAVINANKRFEILLTIIDDLQKQIDDLKVKNK